MSTGTSLMLTPEKFMDRLRKDFIGFDSIWQLLDDTATAVTPSQYPPYNIEQLDDENWSITLAVAGFTDADLNIKVQDRRLTISGQLQTEEQQKKYHYKGIASRAFERAFILAEGVEVKGAELSNGMLKISLQRHIPEKSKMHQIPIKSS